jgi:LuxR family maltose regulon positive regulatory protein
VESPDAPCCIILTTAAFTKQAMVQHLLATKYQLPPLPPKLIQRRRLLELLDHGLQPSMRLTLLSAPAGYGKTTLLRAWIHDRSLPAAWVSLDEGDNDPMRFTHYLLAAIHQGFPELEPPALPGGSASDLDLAGQILIPLINRLGQSPDPKLLIFDDYHFVQNQAVHGLVGYLLDHLPPQAHILMGTRADPALPITRLRGRGQLNELRMDDLRFQLEEAREFIKMVSGVELEPEDLQRLTHRTEGWVSGLQMAAISLQDHADQISFLQDFSGTDRYIMDYLLDEVLGRQPLPLQEFLLSTSILDRLCGSLCDALLASEGILESRSTEYLDLLDRANLFIVALDDKREWYRYHRLFADLLEARLLQNAPERIPVLHRRASEWFEKQGLMEEAVQHALHTHDWTFAADLVDRTAQEMLLRSETTTLLRWLQQLPEAEVRKRPRLGIYRAWSLMFLGAPLSSFEDQLQPEGGLDDPPGSSSTFRAFTSLFQGQIEEGLEFAERALRELPEDEIFLREFTTYCAAAARIGLGEIDYALEQVERTTARSPDSGNQAAAIVLLSEIAEQRMKELRFEAAERLYRRALELGRIPDGNHLPIAGQALIGLGDIALERYDLEEAAQLIDQGIELTRHWSLIGTLNGYFNKAMLSEALGDQKNIRDSLDILRELSRQFDITEFDDLVVEILENSIRIRSGELEPVREWCARRNFQFSEEERSSDEKKQLITRLYRYQLPILARLEISCGHADQALPLLDDLIQRSRNPQRPFLCMEAEMLRAVALQALGKQASALDALRRALEIAQPVRVMRLFIVEGGVVLELLQEGFETWDSQDLCAFAGQILQKAGVKPAEFLPGLRHMPEALLEVLQYLPTGMTAKELAGELVISTNTIRSHIKSIYAKLGVHNRQQAVMRAKELDLL